MTGTAKPNSLFHFLNFREKILLSLLAVGAVVEEALTDAGDPFNLSYYRRGYSFDGAEFMQERERTARRALYYLKMNKYIRLAKDRRGETYQLTETGLERLFSKFPKLKYRHSRWDGYWRIVIYDIPEKDKKLRERLRTELKFLGFKFIQKSVWVTPQPVENELELFLKREGWWGRILVLKSVLPEAESSKWARVFRTHVKPTPSRDELANAVERLLTEPPLRQFPPASPK